MKVLYVSKALVVAAYRDKLRALGAHVEVTALVPARWGGRGPEGGLEGEVRLQVRRALLHGWNHVHFYPAARQVLDAVRPDLVHIDEEPYSLVTFQFVRLCARRRLPCLFFAWQNLDKGLPPPFGALRAYVFRNVWGGIAGTERAAAVLRRAGFRRSLVVIPQFGVDPERFHPDGAVRRRVRERLAAGPDDFVVGFGGRLSPEKGVHVLLEGVASLPAARLVVLGDGPQRGGLEARARRLGLGERVRFVGYVPSLEMPEWLPAFDVLVLPSLSRPGWVEQFGRILVEAMACGVAVVGSACGEIPRVMGDAGIVVPEGDASALARALRGLAERPEERAMRGRAGRERVLAHYAHERIARATVKFYEALVGCGRVGAGEEVRV